MLHYSKLIIKYKENVKKHDQKLKKLRKRKKMPAIISKTIFVAKKEITDIKSIAENFNKYLTEIGPTLAKKVDSSSVTFDKY